MMYTCQFGPLNADKDVSKHYVTLVLTLKNRSRSPESFIKVIPMMYLCQFGQKLAIASEEIEDKAFSSSYDLENKAKVTKI